MESLIYHIKHLIKKVNNNCYSDFFKEINKIIIRKCIYQENHKTKNFAVDGSKVSLYHSMKKMALNLLQVICILKTTKYYF